MSWFQVIKRQRKFSVAGSRVKIQMKIFRPIVLEVFKDVDIIDRRNNIDNYIDEIKSKYEQGLRREYGVIFGNASRIKQHINKHFSKPRMGTNKIIASILRRNGWKGQLSTGNYMLIRKENILLKKKGVEVPNFKQAIKIAADEFPVNTTLNFTESGEDVRKFVSLARQAYTSLTGNGQHANKVFEPRAFNGRLKFIKSILENYGWDDQSTSKYRIMVKVK